MRIVGGEWRGRTFKAPKGRATRPTTDRVREALFDALSARIGSDFAGQRVLDPFGGSGALGFEALSRGADFVTFVERDRSTARIIAANIADLGATGRSEVVVGDAFTLAGRMRGGPFTLLLLDPPYTLDAAGICALLESLRDAGAVACEALVTWEHAAGAPVVWPDGFRFEAVRRYGSTEIEYATAERGSR
jgi:16S rRNA (guanine966-N2)-methyltransferase